MSGVEERQSSLTERQRMGYSHNDTTTPLRDDGGGCRKTNHLNKPSQLKSMLYCLENKAVMKHMGNNGFIRFTDLDECFRKANEHICQPGMGAVLCQKKMYTKKNVPEFSRDAKLEPPIEGCYIFWCEGGLRDLTANARKM
mmetsp:Transcript_22282/g.39690  ORF Transcript_22282/g.39690 Transcript_22282/m.39690 type:complete len:141 (-) Transcript_22282:2269-2691(-)